MAVVVSVYGKADMKQIAKAEKDLASMKREVAGQSGTWKSWGSNVKNALNAGTVAFAAVGLAVAKSVSTYQAYGKEIKTVMRLTGATSEVSSTLTGQWRLSGVAAEKGAAGMKFLSKAMYAARSEGSAQEKVFATLGITLKDSNGAWIDSATILTQVRDKMAGMKDATARTALAVQLFGKGGAELLPWLTKSNGEIAKQTALLKSLGLVWTAQDMKKWGDLAQAQRTLSLTMTALQIRVAQVVVPLMTKLLPALTTLAGVMVRIPTPVYQVAAGFLALIVAMNGVLKVKGILEGFGILKGLTGVPGVLGRVAGGFRDSRVAASAFSGAAGTLGGRLKNITTMLAGLPGKITASIVSMGLWVVAIAAVAAAVYLTVKAFNEWQRAEDFLNKQRAEAQSNEEAQLEGVRKKYGENSDQYRTMVQKIKEANADLTASYESELTGLAGWLDGWAKSLEGASWLSGPAKTILGIVAGGTAQIAGWVGLASGGYVPATPGGLAAVLAEGGEGEYVVPESKVGRFAQAALGGGAAPAAPTHTTVIERRVTLTWQTLTGEPSQREKQRLAAWLKPELDRAGQVVAGTGF